MNKHAKKQKSLHLTPETLRQLDHREIRTAQGGGMCSTAAPSGLCPTTSQTCPKTGAL